MIQLAMLVASPGLAQAQAQSDDDFAVRCASWIAKHGYSRDFIAQKTGSRPPPRNKWRDNIKPEELQVGDVVAVSLWPGHVALIEEISRDAGGKIQRLKVSSFNYGHGNGWIDRSCEVTRKFGIEQTFWIAMEEAVGYWRPASRAR